MGTLGRSMNTFNPARIKPQPITVTVVMGATIMSRLS